MQLQALIELQVNPLFSCHKYLYVYMIQTARTGSWSKFLTSKLKLTEILSADDRSRMSNITCWHNARNNLKQLCNRKLLLRIQPTI